MTSFFNIKIEKPGQGFEIKSMLSAKIAALFLLITTCATGAAQAADYPQKPYEAVYEYTAPHGVSEMKMSADGKGKMRTETSTAGMKVVVITDYINGKSSTLLVNQKQAMVSKFDKSNDTGVFDDKTAKEKNAESLGKKVVSGHPCKGWKYKTPHGTSEVWMGEDIQCLVKSVTSTNAGTTSMTMKSYSPKAPGADAFVVPDGYKVISSQ